MTRFRAPVGYSRSQDGGRGGSASFISRFAGLPIGTLELWTDWVTHYHGFTEFSHRLDETNDWTVTETGAGGTRTFSSDLFPPHLIITTDALDNDSVEMQLTAANSFGEMINLAIDHPVYFETMLRFRDAGNADAAVEQVDWFVGLAVTDPTVIDGATDFIGFLKRDLTDDATGRINFVCGDAGGAAGALVDQSVTATGWVALDPTEVQATDRGNRILGANQWIKLAFLVEPTNAAANGIAHCWVNNVPIANNPIDVSGFLPNENICLTLALQNGEAVVKIMDVAYTLVAQSLYDDAGLLI